MILRPTYLSSFFGVSVARQRLDPLDLFAGLLIDGGVPEVDVPVQARVRVVLVFGRWVRVGCARLSGVHSDLQVCVGRAPGCCCTCGAIPLSDTHILPVFVSVYNPFCFVLTTVYARMGSQRNDG